MNVETVTKFQLNNGTGSFVLDVAGKQIIFGNEALMVSDCDNSNKKYIVMKKDAFKKSWLQSMLEYRFKGCDSIEDLAEIIKDFAEFFGSDSSEDFIKYCGKETNKKFLEFILFKTIFNVYANDSVIVKKLFNFNSDDEDTRSEANNRMKKYFGLNFIEEFTFADNRCCDHQLFVFEVCR